MIELDKGIEDYLETARRESGPSSPNPSSDDRRLQLERLAAKISTQRPPGVAVENWFLPAQGREIALRIYRPRSEGPKPLALFFHGGGWVFGSLNTHDYLAAAIAEGVDCVVVSVHYRRAPENKHPAQLDDCWEALTWATAQPDFLGADTRRCAVVGDSAGGHLATLCAIRARDAGAPSLAAQCLIYPMVAPDFWRESYSEFASAPGFTRADAIFAWRSLLTDSLAPPDESAVPSKLPLAGLPPCYIVTAEYDPLRDEGEDYAERLSAAGVAVTRRRASKLIHGFMRAAPFSEAARGELTSVCDYLKQALRA